MTARGRDRIRRVLAGDVVLSRPAPARALHHLWHRMDHPSVRWLTGPVDVVHGTNYVVPPGGGAAELVSIHDLTPWRTPDDVAPTSRAVPSFVDRAIRRGAHVHAISHHTAAEIVDEIGVSPDRVHAIHLAAPEIGPVGRAERGHRRADATEYLLAVGPIEARKEYPTLVRVLERLSARHPHLHLVIAGGSGRASAALDAAIERSTVRDRVRLVGYVTPEVKADLMVGSRAVVSSASYEGFGIVPVEAMRAGVPVVAAAGGALPEVCGDAADLVPVGDVEAMATAIERQLDDQAHREALIGRGRARATHFRWSRTVSELIELYRELASR